MRTQRTALQSASNNSRNLTLLLGAMIGFLATMGGAEGLAVDDWIRAQAATLPVLASGEDAGSPRFTVLRFNTVPLLAQGSRYGAVRIVCPANRKTDLVWMFTDVTNIDEYRLIPLKPGPEVSSAVRQIYLPTASLDGDEDSARGRAMSSLPRPWDLFQLHMIGVPAALLMPGDEYIIWFRFGDRRPTDVLLAASFVAPLPTMEPAALPPVLALPPQPLAP